MTDSPTPGFNPFVMPPDGKPYSGEFRVENTIKAGTWQARVMLHAHAAPPEWTDVLAVSQLGILCAEALSSFTDDMKFAAAIGFVSGWYAPRGVKLGAFIHVQVDRPNVQRSGPGQEA